MDVSSNKWRYARRWFWWYDEWNSITVVHAELQAKGLVMTRSTFRSMSYSFFKGARETNISLLGCSRFQIQIDAIVRSGQGICWHCIMREIQIWRLLGHPAYQTPDHLHAPLTMWSNTNSLRPVQTHSVLPQDPVEHRDYHAETPYVLGEVLRHLQRLRWLLTLIHYLMIFAHGISDTRIGREYQDLRFLIAWLPFSQKSASSSWCYVTKPCVCDTEYESQIYARCHSSHSCSWFIFQKLRGTEGHT